MLGGVPTRRWVPATMLQFPDPSTNELVSGISLTRLGGLFMWVARMSRSASGSLICDTWELFRNLLYSRTILGVAISIISRFSSQNSITWKNGALSCMPRPNVFARQPSRCPMRSTSSASCGTDNSTWNGQVCGGVLFVPKTT